MKCPKTQCILLTFVPPPPSLRTSASSLCTTLGFIMCFVVKSKSSVEYKWGQRPLLDSRSNNNSCTLCVCTLYSSRPKLLFLCLSGTSYGLVYLGMLTDNIISWIDQSVNAAVSVLTRLNLGHYIHGPWVKYALCLMSCIQTASSILYSDFI